MAHFIENRPTKVQKQTRKSTENLGDSVGSLVEKEQDTESLPPDADIKSDHSHSGDSVPTDNHSDENNPDNQANKPDTQDSVSVSVSKESQLKPDPQSNPDSDPEIEIINIKTDPNFIYTDILEPILDALGKTDEKTSNLSSETESLAESQQSGDGSSNEFEKISSGGEQISDQENTSENSGNDKQPFNTIQITPPRKQFEERTSSWYNIVDFGVHGDNDPSGLSVKTGITQIKVDQNIQTEMSVEMDKDKQAQFEALQEAYNSLIEEHEGMKKAQTGKDSVIGDLQTRVNELLDSKAKLSSDIRVMETTLDRVKNENDQYKLNQTIDRHNRSKGYEGYGSSRHFDSGMGIQDDEDDYMSGGSMYAGLGYGKSTSGTTRESFQNRYGSKPAYYPGHAKKTSKFSGTSLAAGGHGAGSASTGAIPKDGGGGHPPDKDPPDGKKSPDPNEPNPPDGPSHPDKGSGGGGGPPGHPGDGGGDGGGGSNPSSEGEEDYDPDYNPPRGRGRPRYPRIPYGPSLRLSDGFPRKFDGVKQDQCKAHAESMEDYFLLHGIRDNHTKIQRFKLSLEGRARIWLDPAKEKLLYHDLVKEFIKHFSGITSFQSNLHKFRSLKWNETESLEFYKMTLTLLSEMVGHDKPGQPPSKELKTQFIIGLPHAYQMALSDLTEDSDMELIVKRAQKYWDTKRLNQVTAGQVTFADTTTGLGMAVQAEKQQTVPKDDQLLQKIAMVVEKTINGENDSKTGGKSNNKGRNGNRNGNNKNRQQTDNRENRDSSQERETWYRDRYRGDRYRDPTEYRSRYSPDRGFEGPKGYGRFPYERNRTYYQSRDNVNRNYRQNNYPRDNRRNDEGNWSRNPRYSNRNNDRWPSRSPSRERNWEGRQSNTDRPYNKSSERESTPSPVKACHHCRSTEHLVRRCPKLYEVMKSHFQDSQN